MSDIMDNSDTQKYEYSPLEHDDSIRLILLQAGPLDSEINCTVEHTTLDECRTDLYDQYTALSYVWGDASDLRAIKINGLTFHVTANLAAALNGLRHETKTFRMWADAICIDQSNIPERNHQVPLMMLIYTLASRTIIYLGESTSDCDIVFKAAHSPEAMETISLEVRRAAATYVLSRPWFTRVWIFQELVLSKDVFVQFGRNTLTWGDLYIELKSFAKTPKSEVILHDGGEDSVSRQPALIVHMNEARRNYRIDVLEGGKSQSLFDILQARRGLGVSNPRDIIYGHLAVVDPYTKCGKERATKDIVVNYAKSVAEVYTDATLHMIKQSGNLEVLAHVETGDSSNRRSELPSWVPDWSVYPSSARDHIKPRRWYTALGDEKELANSNIMSLGDYLEAGKFSIAFLGHEVEVVSELILGTIDGHVLDLLKTLTGDNFKLSMDRALARIGKNFAIVPKETRIGDVILFDVRHKMGTTLVLRPHLSPLSTTIDEIIIHSGLFPQITSGVDDTVDNTPPNCIHHFILIGLGLAIISRNDLEPLLNVKTRAVVVLH